MPDTRKIINKAIDVSGHGLQVHRKNMDNYGIHATVHLARQGEPDHVVAYDSKHEELLDYLIAHECGHIIRTYLAAPEQRLVPSTDAENRRHVEAQLEAEVPDEIRVLPKHMRKKLVQMWHEGLVKQVANFPADMRIERWMKESYDGLQDLQRRAIDMQIVEHNQVLRHEVRRFTPERVYNPSIAMNSAYAFYMSMLYNDWRFFEPYGKQGYEMLASELSLPVWGTRDDGHLSDIFAVNDWAQRFGIGGWFHWVRLESG